MAHEDYWFKHDANALGDEKIEALVLRYGMAGYGMYWVVVETLRKRDDYHLPRKAYVIDAIARKTMSTPEQVEEFLAACIEDFELLHEDESGIYSESLCRRMQAWEESKQKRSEAGRRGGVAKAKRSRSNATAMPEQRVAIRGEERREEESREEGGDPPRPEVVDPVLAVYRNELSRRLPATSWRDLGKQTAALHRLAKMTRETWEDTPVDSPEEFALMIVAQYEQMRRDPRAGTYWKNAAFDPVGLELRYGDVATRLADSYEERQRQAEALARTEEFLNASG